MRKVAEFVDDGEARPPELAMYSATAVATTVAKSVGDGEARPPGMAKSMATAKSELAESPGELPDEAGPSWLRANGTSSAVVSTVAKPLVKLGLLRSRSAVPRKSRTCPFLSFRRQLLR